MCQQQPCKYQMRNPTWLIELHKNVLRKEYDKLKWEHSVSNIKIKNAQKNYKYSTNANSKVICCESWFWGDLNLRRYLGHP